jgi:hypothetical protein
VADGAAGNLPDGLKYTVKGNKLTISGNTFPAKERIKAAGFRWDGANKAWATSGTPDQLSAKLAKLAGGGGGAGASPAQTTTADVDVVISTAHKAKGLEWDNVRIADDFRGPRRDKNDPEVVHMPDPEELRLAYVAVTRAKKKLDPGSLSWVYSYTDDEDEDPNVLNDNSQNDAAEAIADAPPAPAPAPVPEDKAATRAKMQAAHVSAIEGSLTSSKFESVTGDASYRKLMDALAAYKASPSEGGYKTVVAGFKKVKPKLAVRAREEGAYGSISAVSSHSDLPTVDLAGGKMPAGHAAQWDRIPENVLSFVNAHMRSRGGGVVYSKDGLEAYQEHFTGKTTPRASGSDTRAAKDVHGLYDPDSGIVVIDRGAFTKPDDDVIAHEMSHALDYALGEYLTGSATTPFSGEAAFSTAYRRLVRALRTENGSAYDWYLTDEDMSNGGEHNGTWGSSETFAELYRAYMDAKAAGADDVRLEAMRDFWAKHIATSKVTDVDQAKNALGALYDVVFGAESQVDGAINDPDGGMWDKGADFTPESTRGSLTNRLDWIEGLASGATTNEITTGFVRSDETQLDTPEGTHWPSGEDKASQATRSRLLKALDNFSPGTDIDTMARNIVAAFRSATPREREDGVKWYARARDFARDEMKGDLSLRQKSAILAAFSPQTGWEANKAIALRFTEFFSEDPVITEDFLASTATSGGKTMTHGQWLAKNTGMKKAGGGIVPGKRLSEYSVPEQIALFQTLVKDDENPVVAPTYTTEGTLAREGAAKVKTPTGPTIASAMRAFYGEDTLETINAALSGHKVRSFYNNIVTGGESLDSVTVDTHALDAALLGTHAVRGSNKAFSLVTEKDGSTTLVDGQTFLSSGGGERKVEGLKGSYPLFWEAFRRATEQINDEDGTELTMPQVQAVAWIATLDDSESSRILGTLRASADENGGTPNWDTSLAAINADREGRGLEPLQNVVALQAMFEADHSVGMEELPSFIGPKGETVSRREYLRDYKAWDSRNKPGAKPVSDMVAQRAAHFGWKGASLKSTKPKRKRKADDILGPAAAMNRSAIMGRRKPEEKSALELPDTRASVKPNTTNWKRMPLNGAAGKKRLEELNAIHKPTGVGITPMKGHTHVWIRNDAENPQAIGNIAVFEGKGVTPKYVQTAFHKVVSVRQSHERLTAYRPHLAKLEADTARDALTDDNAAVLRLMLASGIRVDTTQGADISQKGTGATYGASSLQARHVQLLPGGVVRLRFRGKMRRINTVDFKDPVVHTALAARLDRLAEGGDTLFSERNGEASLFPNFDYKEMQDYLRARVGERGNAHDLRRNYATTLAAGMVGILPVPKNQDEYVKAITAVGTQVSAHINDNPGQSLQSYIDPFVFSGWRNAVGLPPLNVGEMESAVIADAVDEALKGKTDLKDRFTPTYATALVSMGTNEWYTRGGYTLVKEDGVYVLYLTSEYKKKSRKPVQRFGKQRSEAAAYIAANPNPGGQDFEGDDFGPDFGEVESPTTSPEEPVVPGVVV